MSFNEKSFGKLEDFEKHLKESLIQIYYNILKINWGQVGLSQILGKFGYKPNYSKNWSKITKELIKLEYYN